jgi:hypothetical protein
MRQNDYSAGSTVVTLLVCEDDRSRWHEAVAPGVPCLKGEVWTVPIEMNLLETPVGKELHGKIKL